MYIKYKLLACDNFQYIKYTVNIFYGLIDFGLTLHPAQFLGHIMTGRVNGEKQYMVDGQDFIPFMSATVA